MAIVWATISPSAGFAQCSVRPIDHLQGFPRKAHHSAASDLDRGAGTFSKRTLPAGTIQVIASTASRPRTDPSSMIGVMHRE
jgi:hypothetical protein